MVETSSISEKDIIAADGIVVINNEHHIIAFNNSAQRITGFSEDEIILNDFKKLIPAIESDGQYILNALKSGDSYSNLPLNFSKKNEQTMNVLASITPLKPPGKGIVGAVLIFRDTKEMTSLVESLRQKTIEIMDEKNKLESIFNSRLEGTFTIDKDWVITSFNASAERITGYSSGEAIGKKCWEIFHCNKCRKNCHMDCTMSSQETTINNELIIVTKQGKQVPVRVNTAPLFKSDGKQVGAVETFQDISEIKNLTTHLEERYHFENIIGNSKAMQKIYVLLESVSNTNSTVLITGESGTGKELVARAIHLNSERKSGPFMAINCSAFAETLLESELFGHEKGSFTGAVRTKLGRFELAQNGTLFLDEIGDLSQTVQVKLLRVLETRQFERVGGTKSIDMDVRIITATNKDLQEEVKSGRFREDLYYRLNVINIHLPPLRERMEDFPLLIEHFLDKFRKKFNKPIKGISAAAFKLLQNYHWPGNIRSLENVLEHAFVLCHNKIIQTECLPERLWYTRGKERDVFDDVDKLENPLENAEKILIQNLLKKFNGHRGKTAESLKINKATLWRKMKKYKLF